MVGEEFVALLNEILANLEGDDYAEALSVIEQVDTLLDAVERGGVLDRLSSDAMREEVTAVLNALPPAVDEALMGTVKRALARRVRVVTQWEGYKTIEVRISEEPRPDGPTIRIVFASPMGHIFRR
jgi:hypothetical protein